MKQKSLTIALLTLCLMGLAAFLTSCDSRCFIGNCSVAPDAFRLDIDRMTGTDRFTVELSAGDMRGCLTKKRQLLFGTKKHSDYENPNACGRM